MKTIKINKKDNVIIALEKINKGEQIEDIIALEDIEPGHKIAAIDIEANQNIYKYGEAIGHATIKIKKGEHVHSHNMKTNLSGLKEYSYTQSDCFINSYLPKRKIYGYKRKNGKVGIRNELWIIVTVGCVNQVANKIIKAFTENHNISKIDGIYTYAHPYGCSQMGEDHQNTVKILQDIVQHPNAGGVLILGLGCENNQLSAFYHSLSNIDPERIKYFNCQDVDNEIDKACQLLSELLAKMNNDQREEIKFSDITFGLKCGGSDGLSGITANPLVGKFCDKMAACGSSIILSEVPEMFGAEHILMNRAKNVKTFDKIVKLINNYKQYFIDHKQVVYENPSPGNKAGGITTLEDKSLGCIQKAGSSSINGVLDYGEQVCEKGVNLLYGPGNDIVSVTALAASGSQIVLFTTGRGTPFGGFIPTVKISTNSKLFETKPHWIDFNAGSIAEGCSMEEVSEQLVDYIIDVINGKYTNNEKNGYKEIAIFKQGVTL